MSQPTASPPREVALDHYRDTQLYVEATATVAGNMWSEINPDNIVGSWAQQVPELTQVVSGAQLGVARQADGYVGDALESQALDDEAVGTVIPQAFAGTASDGRGLMALLTNPVFITLASIADGIDVNRALFSGRAHLDTIVRTQVADAGRLADQASLIAHPAAQGYVRVAVGKSCGRCLVLAGTFYLWNRGFQRHPMCDCKHLPTSMVDPRRGAGWRGLIRDPREVYDSMTRAERLRAGFTLGDQRALAEGADINQIVNARHRPGALRTAGGRRFTTEGTTRLGVAGRRLQGAPRMTPDEIFRQARSRDDAVRLLEQHGYILGTTPAPSFTVPTPGIAGAIPPAVPVPVRPTLASALDAQDVGTAFRGEWRRITGREIDATFSGSVLTAREHAEGLLRGAERFPAVRLQRVGPSAGWETQQVAYAATLGREMEFSTRWTPATSRKAYVDATGHDAATRYHPPGTGSPTGIALHEFGHLIDEEFLGRRLHAEVTTLVQARAAARGVDFGTVVDEVSQYGRNGPDARELIAEAFADVMTNGPRASALSREIFDLLEAEYRRGPAAVGVAARMAPSTPDLSRLSITQLRRLVTGRGITVPTGIRKPALIKLADDLEQGVPADVARARAVRSILEERQGIAQALTDAAEVLGSSERALRFTAGSVRRAVSPEQAKVLKPLLDALDAADPAAARAAIPRVATAAKLRQVGGLPGDVVPFQTGRMEFVGASRGATVSVVRPGWETTLERKTTLISRAAVQPTDVVPPVKVVPGVSAQVRIDRSLDPADIVAAEERARTAALAAPPVRLPDLGQRSQRALALRYYQRHGDENMNGLLRSGRVRKAEGQKVAPPEAEVRASIEQIDQAMAASVLTEPIVVYRGMSTPTGIFRGPPGSAMGRTFTEKGFSSTSASRRQAMHWSSGEVGDVGVVLEVRVPAGTRALTLSDESFIGAAPTRISEQEILLDRGLTYRVVSDETIGDAFVAGGVGRFSDPYRHIVVEVVPARTAVKAAKAAPAKKAAPAASDPAAEVVSAAVALERRPGDWVPIADIRERLSHLTRQQQDAALERLALTPGAHVVPWDNFKALTARDRAAALRFGGADSHAVRIDPSATALRETVAPAKATKKATPRKAAAPDLTGARGLSADAAVREVQVDNRVREAVRALEGERTPGFGGRWVPLAFLRDHPLLRDLSRADVDEALRRFAVTPGSQVIPWDNRKALTKADHDAAVRIGGDPSHVIRIDDTTLQPLPAAPAKAAKAAPKPPPTPAKMTAPALRTELKSAGVPEALLVDVPKPQLATWTTRVRGMSPAQVTEETGRIRQVLVDKRRAASDALVEVQQLLADGASASALRTRGAAALRKLEQTLDGWPELPALRRVMAAVSTGNERQIRTAIAAAERKIGLRRVGDAGSVSRFDRAVHSPLAGARIADDAQVRVVRPGYEVDIGGQRVVLGKPVVEEAGDRLVDRAMSIRLGIPEGMPVPADVERLSEAVRLRLSLAWRASPSRYSRYLDLRRAGEPHTAALQRAMLPTVAQSRRQVGTPGAPTRRK